MRQTAMEEGGMRVLVVVVGALVACEGPLEGRRGAVVEVSVGGPDAPDTSDGFDAPDTVVPSAPCGDAGLWAFPGGDLPEHVVTAPDGDALVAGRGVRAGSNRGRLVRIDAEDCAAIWQVELACPAVGLAMLADDVVVAIACADGTGRALRLAGASGAPRWELASAGDACAVGAHDDVWVATRGGELERRDAVGALGMTTRVDPGADRDALVVTDVVVQADGEAIVGGRVERRFVLWRVAPDGAVRWRRALDDAILATAGPRLASGHDSDSVFVTGLARSDGDDVQLVTRVTDDGTTDWSWRAPADLVRHMGGPAPAVATAGGDLVLAGVVFGPTELAPDRTIVPTEVGAFEGYVARFAPHMAVIWTVEPIGGIGDQRVLDVAGDDAGRQWVVGTYDREVVVGEHRLGSDDGAYMMMGFVARRPLGIGW